MKILVFAYSAVGYACLEFLIRQGEEIVAVVTHKDDPHETLWFPSVEKLAKEHGISVFFPDNPNDPDFIATLQNLHPDLIFSFYYRRILSERILNLAPFGAFNIHGSFLPNYRGRCPINWAIIEGELQTGVTLHCMVAKADAGNIIDQIRIPIGENETAGDITEKVCSAAPLLLSRSLRAVKKGTASHHPQDISKGRYYGGRTPEDNVICWSKSPRTIHNLIRSQLPYPQFSGATTTYKGSQLRILGSLVKPLLVPIDTKPGQILSLAPLYVAGDSQDMVVEILEFAWIDEPHELEVGLCFEENENPITS